MYLLGKLIENISSNTSPYLKTIIYSWKTFFYHTLHIIYRWCFILLYQTRTSWSMWTDYPCKFNVYYDKNMTWKTTQRHKKTFTLISNYSGTCPQRPSLGAYISSLVDLILYQRWKQTVNDCIRNISIGVVSHSDVSAGLIHFVLYVTVELPYYNDGLEDCTSFGMWKYRGC